VLLTEIGKHLEKEKRVGKSDKRWFCLIFITSLFFVRCKNQPVTPDETGYQYTEPAQTDDGWETGSLSSVGMDKNVFEDMVMHIDRGDYTEIHSILVARSNRLVFEKYWAGHDFGVSNPQYHGTYIEFGRNTRHNTHSATKSMVSALVGIAIDLGIITDEDRSIFNYLSPEYDIWNNEGREQITVKHCLMMASGLEWNEWDAQTTSSNNDMVRFNLSYDPIDYLLSKPLVSQPGSSFYYNGGTVDLLGVLVGHAALEDIQLFSSDHLFGPLGITNYNWAVLYPSGMTCCHGDIHITPRDMAKIGQLFLNGGEWNGTCIISEEWVEKSTQNYIDPGVTWADGYGYLWWLRNLTAQGRTYESFKAIGWGGQEIFVFRDMDMVVVFTGANYVSDPPCDEIMKRYILPSIEN
jgi:CubicO group peptidase (beta-lactamase class C family)